MIVLIDIDIKLDGEMENSWFGDLLGSDGLKYKVIEIVICCVIYEGILVFGYWLLFVCDFVWEVKIIFGIVVCVYKLLVEVGVLEVVVGCGIFVV